MARQSIPSAQVEAFERGLIESGKEIVARWKDYLDAPNAPKLESATDRYVMAMMLDNQNKILSGHTSEAVQAT